MKGSCWRWVRDQDDHVSKSAKMLYFFTNAKKTAKLKLYRHKTCVLTRGMPKIANARRLTIF